MTEQFKAGMVKDWRVELLEFFPGVFQTSGLLHVAILVYLRLSAISNPTGYQDRHHRFRHISVIIIWIVSVAVNLLAVLTQCFESGNFYYWYRYIELHIFNTIPFLAIIVMYGRMVIVLRQKMETTNYTGVNDIRKKNAISSLSRKMTLLVQRVVVAFLICYLPYLVWMQFYYMTTPNQIPFVVDDLEVEI